MKITKDVKINFDKVIITPLERWIDTELELDKIAIDYLNQLAEKSNQSVDNVVNHILSDMMAEHLELSELNAESLRKTAKKSSQILLVEKDNPVARIKMIEDKEDDLILITKKILPKEDTAEGESKPVTNCERLATVAAIASKRKRRPGGILQ
ncbi:hypothetical protein [uncultured Treponema sp.]|uniref:hypothetical protein n=1 Tax=uncultured Treponema sp. TaxID=162155 RepID=UPI0025FAA188|nr:hypothetical protein [uncultured Treponema sp.]